MGAWPGMTSFATAARACPFPANARSLLVLKGQAMQWGLPNPGRHCAGPDRGDAGTDDSPRDTSISSMAVPMLVTHSFTYRAVTGENPARIVAGPPTPPLKPFCAELNTM